MSHIEVVRSNVSALNKGLGDITTGDPEKIERQIGYAEAVIRALYELRVEAAAKEPADSRPDELTETAALNGVPGDYRFGPSGPTLSD